MNRSAARRPVACRYCDYTTCTTCVKVYLLSTLQEPHCMQCRHEWSAEFIDESMSKVWRMGEWRKHRENILLERERSLMPDTQRYVERELRARELEQLSTDLMQTVQDLHRQMRQNVVEAYRLRDFTRECPIGGDAEEGEQQRRAATFIRRCPAAGCLGFLSTQWRCGICKTQACPKCHAVVVANGHGQEKHACDPLDIESVKAIEKDSRPCPRCAAMIHKIDGCDQMWCTQCHALFSWRDGTMLTGRVHNPHYYEWQRLRANNGENGGAVPRELRDIPCGGMPDWWDVRRKLVDLGFPAKAAGSGELERLMAVHRHVVHIQDVVMRDYVTPGEDDALALARSNLDLRMAYMLKEMGEEEYKAALHVREKHRTKRRAIWQVYDVVAVTAAEMFLRIVNMCTSRQEVRDIMSELDQICAYANASFKRISLRFSCVAPFLNRNLEVLSVRYRAQD